MRVGDLVKFKNNGQLGLVVRVFRGPLSIGLADTMYAISWMDGHVGNRWADELEVVSPLDPASSL